VARYADACNVFGGPETIHRKYEILRAHCEAIGRDPNEVERTTLQSLRLVTQGARTAQSPDQIVDRFGELADAGAQHVIFSLHDATPELLELIGREVLPQVRDL
jgi:alkanesulfonate monooxygenase